MDAPRSRLSAAQGRDDPPLILIHCAGPFQLPMIQDQWREIYHYYPGLRDVELPPERPSTPDAIVRAHTSVCRLRSLVLHDLSIQDTRSWIVLFTSLKEPPERHSIARYLEQLDMQLKPCNDEATTAVLVAAKEMLLRNTRLQRFILRGHFVHVRPHCDAVRELDQLTFFHSLSEAFKVAFFSVFATKSTEQSVKRPRNTPETVLPPYLDAAVLDLVLS